MITFHVFLFMMIANTCSTVNGNVYFRATNPTNEWWSNTIIYQVYIRSFKDSDNDGIGDLKGIIQKLDHFTDLGIETLWVGPFFKSPMDDMGYDVEDFYMIDPIFGTMDDFKELVFEMNKRNLKLIIDLILNHSSYKCEWFEKSIKQEGKYKDYYMWHNASNQDEVLSNSSITPIPPNNWLSVFGGPAWTWNQQRNQFYFHQFAKEQPDFNLRNSDVKLQLLDVMEFWMFQGVSGFRFDSVNFLYENVSLLDEPFLPGKNNFTEYKGLEHIYTRNQPENIIIVLEWRAFMESFTKNKNISISRSLLGRESYIVVTNFGSETETVILSNIIHDVKDVFYVYLGSENSAYNTGSIVSTVPSIGNPVILRPKSVVVLSDEYIAPETPTVNIQNAGTQIGSTLISLLSVLLLLRYFL